MGRIPSKHIACGILRYVRDIAPDIDIFKDSVFAEFQKTLDSEMKRLRANGLARLQSKES